MAIVMHMRWPGATVEQYEQVRVETNFEGDAPSGGLYHVAAHDGEGLRVVDTWETAAHFQQFVETRLMPAVVKLGLPGEPQIEIFEAINIFAPGYTSK